MMERPGQGKAPQHTEQPIDLGKVRLAREWIDTFKRCIVDADSPMQLHLDYVTGKTPSGEDLRLAILADFVSFERELQELFRKSLEATDTEWNAASVPLDLGRKEEQ